jgi:hypothetical protein
VTNPHHQDLPWPATAALDAIPTYDDGTGITLVWVSPNLWRVGDSDHMITAETVETLASAGLIKVGELVEGRNDPAHITEAGRDYLTHHQDRNRHIRKDNDK